MRRRVLFFTILFCILFFMLSCSQDAILGSNNSDSNSQNSDSGSQGQNNDKSDYMLFDDVYFKKIQFNDFSAFSLMVNDTGSRDIGDQSTSFVGYNYEDNKLEEIAFIDDTGENWTVDRLRKVGSRYLLMDIVSPTSRHCYVLIDVFLSRAFHVDDGMFDAEYVYQTDVGIIWRENKYDKQYGIKRLNPETGIITYVNNPDYDGNLTDFYASKSGHVFAGDTDKSKYYPADGSVPQTILGEWVRWHIRYRNHDFAFGIGGIALGSYECDYVIDLSTKIKYTFTDTGIEQAQLDIEDNLIGRRIAQSDDYDVSCGFIAHIVDNEKIVVSRIVNGDFYYYVYDLPADFDLEMTEKAYVLTNGVLIYEDSNTGVYCYNYETGELKTVFDGAVASWELNGDGVTYSKYITATTVSTFYFDFNKGETSLLSESKMETIQAVWFDIGNRNHVHTYSDVWTFNESKHWHEATCSDTNQKYCSNNHSIGPDGICTVCGYEHAHSYSEEWSSDEKKHWHVATCGCTEGDHTIDDYEDHCFDNSYMCTICGFQHIHVFPDDWATKDVEGVQVEYKECDGCGKELINGVFDISVDGVLSVRETEKETLIGDIVVPQKVFSVPVGSIKDNAFYNCNQINSLSLPNTVLSIGSGAFSQCSSLETIIFAGTVEEWNSIIKNENWNSNVPATIVNCTDGDVDLTI